MMMTYPKITIVTAVYNQAAFIEKALRSVLDQGYPNLEYIVVDGGSTDGTLDIINRYKEKITKIISGPDQGMYDALNKGFEQSTGEIMAWLNSDDMYHAGSLFSVAEIFSKFKEVEFLMGQKTTYDESGRCFITGTLRSWSKYDFFIHGSHMGIQQESIFWRRSLWERSGKYISRDYKLAGDCELWTRFLTKGNAAFYMTNAMLGGFRVRDGQLSADGGKYMEEVKLIYNKVERSVTENHVLGRIAFHKKYLTKIPVLRVVFGWNKKLESLFNYPPFIKYNFRKKEFEKSKF